jgi:hypothetical protein
MWEPLPLTTLRAFMVCYRDSFTFLPQFGKPSSTTAKKPSNQLLLVSCTAVDQSLRSHGYLFCFVFGRFSSFFSVPKDKLGGNTLKRALKRALNHDSNLFYSCTHELFRGKFIRVQPLRITPSGPFQIRMSVKALVVYTRAVQIQTTKGPNFTLGTNPRTTVQRYRDLPCNNQVRVSTLIASLIKYLKIIRSMKNKLTNKNQKRKVQKHT